MLKDRFAAAALVLLVASCAAEGEDTATRGTQPAPFVAGSAAHTAAGRGGIDVGLPISTPTTSGTAGMNGGPAHPSTMPTDPMGECGAVVQMAENMSQPVDVIFAIDTSGSMAEEIDFVQANMNAFSKQIRDSGVDVRVILLAGDKTGMPQGFYTDGVCIGAPLGSGSCPADSNPPVYTHVVEPIMQRNILDSYILLYPRYKEYLRPNSLKTFVSISDDDAMRMGFSSDPKIHVEKFMSDVKTLDPSAGMWSNWHYSAIYPFTECLGSFSVGTAHAELVKRTGGVSGDLCLQDFAPVFNEIARQLVTQARLSCDWEIPPPPMGQAFEPMKTNVRLTLGGMMEQLFKSKTVADCGMREAWHYDDESSPKRVVACPATCTRIQAAANASVSVLFGCATLLGPQ